jgi:hypothetical protein
MTTKTNLLSCEPFLLNLDFPDDACIWFGQRASSSSASSFMGKLSSIFFICSSIGLCLPSHACILVYHAYRGCHHRVVPTTCSRIRWMQALRRRLVRACLLWPIMTMTASGGNSVSSHALVHWHGNSSYCSWFSYLILLSMVQ